MRKSGIDSMGLAGKISNLSPARKVSLGALVTTGLAAFVTWGAMTYAAPADLQVRQARAHNTAIIRDLRECGQTYTRKLSEGYILGPDSQIELTNGSGLKTYTTVAAGLAQCGISYEQKYGDQ